MQENNFTTNESENLETKGRTISEIKSDRSKLQEEILTLIRRFEMQNEVHVENITLMHSRYVRSPLPETVDVKVDFNF